MGMSILYGGSIFPLKKNIANCSTFILWAQDHAIAIAYRLPLMTICSTMMDMGAGPGFKEHCKLFCLDGYNIDAPIYQYMNVYIHIYIYIYICIYIMYINMVAIVLLGGSS